MSLDGDRGQVTLQVKLASNRSKIPIKTSLLVTVEKFKLILAKETHIPPEKQCLVYKGNVLKNPKTLKSYELEPDQTIHLVRLGMQPTTAALSLSRFSNLSYVRENNGLNDIQCRSLDIAAIKSLPMLSKAAQDPEVDKMLENPVILRCVLSYLFYVDINRGKASDEADVKSIKSQIETYKLKCMYDAQQEIEQAHGSKVYKGAYDDFLGILLSDATILRYYKEQGESIDGAITAMLGWDDARQDQSPPGLASLDVLLSTHSSLYQKLLLALPDDENYSSSSSSNDGSDDIASDEGESELLSSQLAQMEEMGFLNWHKNLRALLNSGADVEEAIEMLQEETNLKEGQ